MKFEKILVTTDFSEDSIRAFDIAAYEAKMQGSKITLAYVFDEFFIPPTVLGKMPNPQKIIEDSKSASLEKLNALAEEHFHSNSIEIDTALISTKGDIGEEICNYAKENNFNLIVISSHGKLGFQKFLLGSTAEKVARLSPCPVMIIPWSPPQANK